MKNTCRLFLFFFALVIFHKPATAQNQQKSPIRISDLSPGTEIDSIVSQENKIRLFVSFKIDNPTNADSVFFMFGTSKKGKEITVETGKFIKNGSVYSVKTQGPAYEIINSEAICKVKVTKKQFNSSKFLSLVVKDKSGLYTNVLNIRIN